MSTIARRAEPPKVSPLYDPRVRAAVYQAALAGIVTFLIYAAASNVVDNLRAAKIASGFGFLGTTSGFDINQTLVPYSATSTYGRAFVVGLLNTLLVAGIGVVLATFLGFAVGIARLSSNWIVAAVASAYVELIRNVPLLLQLLFWYIAVLRPLPEPRNSVTIPGLTLGTPGIGLVVGAASLGVLSVAAWRAARRVAAQPLAFTAVRSAALLVAAVAVGLFLFGSGLLRTTETGLVFLNSRGLFGPKPIFGDGSVLLLAALAAGLAGAVAVASWARREQARTGRQLPVALGATALIVGLPALAWILVAVAAGNPVTFELPEKQRFNLRGGLQIFPEFVALTLGLVVYTAAFIAEIVRAGITAVPRGQGEAAHSLGLRPGPTLKLVVIPQAMRIIIPPLTSQYLNLTKNSSLAVAIGYPDLVQVFMGTVLNQTGQAIECVAVTMAVYLLISLVTSAVMNEYNRRSELVER